MAHQQFRSLLSTGHCLQLSLWSPYSGTAQRLLGHIVCCVVSMSPNSTTIKWDSTNPFQTRRGYLEIQMKVHKASPLVIKLREQYLGYVISEVVYSMLLIQNIFQFVTRLGAKIYNHDRFPIKFSYSSHFTIEKYFCNFASFIDQFYESRRGLNFELKSKIDMRIKCSMSFRILTKLLDRRLFSRNHFCVDFVNNLFVLVLGT